MNTSKKLLAILLVLGMTCAGMVACKPSPDTPNVPGSNQGNTTEATTQGSATEGQVTPYGNYSIDQPAIKPEEYFAAQIQQSADTFNAGSSYTNEKISHIFKIADYIANYEAYVEKYGVQDQLDELYEKTGFSLDFGFGSDLIAHYLGTSGETFDYSDRMEEMLVHPKVTAAQSTCISAAMKAAENLVKDGQSNISVNQTKPMKLTGLKTEDGTIYYALGEYHTVADLSNVQRTGDTFSATVTFRIIDYYNWSDDVKTPEFTSYLDKLDNNQRALLSQMVDMPTLEGFCQADLAQLHHAGLAQNFLAYGTVTYNITWTVGQNFDQATVTPAQ